MSVCLTIDGTAVETREGRPLVDVAADNGIYIPTLCHLRGHPCLGTCRVCSVRVDGRVVAACSVRVGDGMVVEVDEPELADLRRALVELLFAEGIHNCPSCEKSGRCELQAVGYETGMLAARFPYRFQVRDREHRAARIWLERNRCIFCQRCVAWIRDRSSGRKIFSIEHRGVDARIAIDIALADAMPPEQVHQAVEICPVGCILEKGVGYDDPIGRRRFEVKSIRRRTLEGKTK